MKRILWLTFGLVMFLSLFVACENEETYMVQVSATEGGIIEGPNGKYKECEWVEFKAIPAEGYFFAQWSDGKNDNPREFYINKDLTIIAQFKKITTVDLGLESGTLWTTCNIGAANPWNGGHFYAWGETETKKGWASIDNWDTYKYGSYSMTSSKTLTKYYDADGLTVLEQNDDAATTIYGSDYSTPTRANWEELCSQCYWVWNSKYNNQNVSGYMVFKAKFDEDKGVKVHKYETPSESYSFSDTHIFLPVGGKNGGYKVGEVGMYWSSSRCEDNPREAYCCFFYDYNLIPNHKSYRDDGHSIRAIRRK